MEAPDDRRRAHGPRLALTMADVEAGFGEFERALHWTAVAAAGLGSLPRHYRERHAAWRLAAGSGADRTAG